MSESDKDNNDETVTDPVIVDPCKTYKLPNLQTFITIRAPLETFITPFLAVYVHRRTSRVSKEMRFFFKSRTCLILVSVLKIPSCILIQTVPLPTTSQMTFSI